ncbi:unnamed protein product [Thelazia callipaeda]|uniref:Hexosyltransferase n=1 Tax=Thelazia callipaeda TaxID=103827 RepID=A0A158RAM4_THECL|nr:unnamed protein product [Thelazia callipaeda]
MSGCTDHIFEESFSNFKWPLFINVKEQVLLDLTGQPFIYTYENNWTNIKPFIVPVCEVFSDSKKFVLIVVKTSPQRFVKRETIRATWGSLSNYSGFTIRTVFVMGRSTFSEEDERLSKEISSYNDILMGDYLDSYRNNTLKFLSSIQFSFQYCNQTVPFAFLVDDDYLVLVRNLIEEIKKHDLHDQLYMGWRFDTQPFRSLLYKHRVSLAVYPYDHYPPYIAAGAVLLSLQTIREMYYAIQYVKLYSFDDVYAGILAKSLHLPVQHNSNMRFWSAEVTAEEARTLICAHGFEGNYLETVYNKFRKIGYP